MKKYLLVVIAIAMVMVGCKQKNSASAAVSGISQAVMPDELIVPTVMSMQVGETGWIGASGIIADREGKLWLLKNACFSKEKSGSGKIKIALTNRGYVVDIDDIPADERLWKREVCIYPTGLMSVNRLMQGKLNIGGSANQAVLADAMTRLTVMRLKIGESGWMSPNMLNVSCDGKIWLYGDARVDRFSSRWATMPVSKTDEGYVIDISQVPVEECRWYKDSSDYSYDRNSYVPVFELKH